MAKSKPAPPEDRIRGSKRNKKGSAKSLKSAKNVDFSDSTEKGIANKVDNFRKNHKRYQKIPRKAMINAAKGVMRRANGAYSKSHRPGVSRVQWGYARLGKFLKKLRGVDVNDKYVQDDDLLESLKNKL